MPSSRHLLPVRWVHCQWDRKPAGHKSESSWKRKGLDAKKLIRNEDNHKYANKSFPESDCSNKIKGGSNQSHQPKYYLKQLPMTAHCVNIFKNCNFKRSVKNWLHNNIHPFQFSVPTSINKIVKYVISNSSSFSDQHIWWKGEYLNRHKTNG